MHCEKSTKKILAGVRPPPLLGNARIFTASVTATPPLLQRVFKVKMVWKGLTQPPFCTWLCHQTAFLWKGFIVKRFYDKVVFRQNLKGPRPALIPHRSNPWYFLLLHRANYHSSAEVLSTPMTDSSMWPSHCQAPTVSVTQSMLLSHCNTFTAEIEWQ